LVLKVYPDFTNIQSADLCAGDSMAFGNRWLKNSGTYDDSLVSVFGCDSVVRLKLSVLPADTMITKQGDSLIAHSGTASIRWWDCLNQSYVPYAFGRVFVPAYPSLFAAEITENGCSYTTRCFDFNYLGISGNQSAESIEVTPNPARDRVTIKSNKSNIQKVELLSITGQMVYTAKANSKTLIIDLSDYKRGSYILKVTTKEEVFVRRILRK